MTSPTPSERRSFHRLLPFGIMVAVFTVAILLVAPWPVGVFEDDGIYTVLAKALATGQGYRMINLPGAPHATHFPPGFPFFLSLLWRLFPAFPDNIVVFKFANAAFLAVAALGTYVFARSRAGLGRVAATVSALAGTLSIVVLVLTGIVLSEPMFMALLPPALLLAERAAEDGEVRTAIAAGLLLAVLSLVRTIGVVAIPAAVLVLLMRGHRKGALALLLAGVLPLVPWQLWVSAYQHELPSVLVGKYGAYGPWLSDGYREGGLSFAAHVISANLQRMEFAIGYQALPIVGAVPRAIGFGSAMILCLGGLLALVRRAPVLVVFLASYVAIVLVWPFTPDRFLAAVWPLLTLAIVCAVTRVLRWSPPPKARVLQLVPLAAAVLVVTGHAAYNLRSYRRGWWDSVQRDSGRDAKPLVEWVAHYTATTDVLSTEHDLIVYLYTGRQAVPVASFLAHNHLTSATEAETLSQARAIIERYHPRFYITGWGKAVEAGLTLSSGPQPLLRPAGRTNEVTIFERVGP